MKRIVARSGTEVGEGTCNQGLMAARSLKEAGELKEGGKRDTRRNRNKNSKHCTIYRNRKSTQRREPLRKGREPGVQGTGSGKFSFPCPPPSGRNHYHMEGAGTGRGSFRLP